MKKICFFIFLFLLKMNMFSQIAVSIPTGIMGISNSEIDIPISVSDLTGRDIISYQFKVTFDSNVVNAIDVVTTGTLSGVSGWSVMPNITKSGEVTVGAFGSSALTSSGTLMKIKFKVVGTPGMNTLISFSSFMFNSGSPAVTTSNGGLSVILGTQPYINVTPATRSLPYTAGSAAFAVSNIGAGTMNWMATITEGSSWITFSGGSSGIDTGTIRVNCAANTDTLARTGKIKIESFGAVGSPKEVTITQAAYNPPITVDVSIPIDSATIGTTEVNIPVNINGITGKDVIAFQFKILYNKDVLTALDLSTTDCISGVSGWTVLPNTSVPGEVSIGAFGSAALTGNGALLKIRFHVLGGVGSSSNLTLSSFIFNSGSPVANLTNGSIKIYNPIQTVLSVNPVSINVPENGGSSSIDVSNTGNGTMDWIANITEGASWLYFVSGSYGTNSGKISFSCFPNPNNTIRTAKIVITAPSALGNPKEVIVTQAAHLKIPIISTNVGTVAFSRTLIYQTSDTTFKIKNNGDEVLLVTALILDGPYKKEFALGEYTFPLTIQPGDAVPIRVSFTPQDTTARLARILINSNDPVIPQAIVILTGSGKLAVPNAPQMISFGNNSIADPSNLILLWNSIKGATSYRLQIARDFTFLNIVNDITTKDTSAAVTNLDNNTTYYFRISVTTPYGSSVWSQYLNFTTSKLKYSSPSLVFPLNNSNVQSASIQFKWKTVSSAVSYTLQVTKDSLQSSTLLEFPGLTDTVKTLSSFAGNSYYLWRVKASSSIAESKWSEIWNFSTSNRPPAVFDLISPKYNSVVDLIFPSKSTIFTWYKTTDPDLGDKITYTLSIFIPEFTIKKANLTDTTISLDMMSYLKTNSSYTWSVTASDGKDNTVCSLDYIFFTGSKITKVDQGANQEILSYSLDQNYPNPFNPSTRISYSLPENSFVSIKIFNALGGEVGSLINKSQPAGMYSIDWHPDNLPSGVYYYKLQAGSFSESKKMLYLR